MSKYLKSNTARQYLILGKDTPFNVSEAYKTARTNLIFTLNSIKNKNTKIVLISSTAPIEGKTTVAMNLAAAFAEAGNNVLLIDADMRKPRLHRIFGLNPTPGLSDMLSDFSQKKCLRKTSHENLILMPAGTIPPNPAELLMSENLKELIEKGFSTFDYVFIDSPPIGIVTDAAVLAPLTDGVILVSRQGYTEKNALIEAAKSFNKVGAKILGHIFNDVDYENSSYKYKYKGYGYHYKYRHSDSDDID